MTFLLQWESKAKGNEANCHSGEFQLPSTIMDQEIKLSKGPQFSPGFLRHEMQSIKSKGRMGTERSSVQSWNQCTDRNTQSSPCVCKELGNAAQCDPGRSRLFSIKSLGNPHQGSSINVINALWLWEDRGKPRWKEVKEVPLAGLAGRIPHRSPSTSSFMGQILTVKWGAGVSMGNAQLVLPSHAHILGILPLSINTASSPGQNTPKIFHPPGTFLPCKPAWPWHSYKCSIIQEGFSKSAVPQVGQGCLICLVMFLEQVVGIPTQPGHHQFSICFGGRI